MPAAVAHELLTSVTHGPDGADERLPEGPLIVVVTGDRNWSDYPTLRTHLDQFWIGELHEGGAPGADTYARYWAHSHKVTHREHPARWTTEGRAAGPRRNVRMYVEAKPDLVVAFKDNFGSGGGTEHMVSVARKGGTPVWLVSHGQGRWVD